MGKISNTTFGAGQDDYFPAPQTQLDLESGVLKQDSAY